MAMSGLRQALSLAAITLGAACLWAETTGLQVRNNFSAQGLNYSLAEGRGSAIRLGWKPALFAEYYPGGNVRISAEVETDAWARGVFETGADRQSMDLGLYRAWGAVAVAQTELKAGLQHIRMGTAQILRPLMWFDRLRPESFLEETSGVWALTLDHFFPNPELRLWLMPAADKLKGAEVLPSLPDSWEAGGRIGFTTPGATPASVTTGGRSHLPQRLTRSASNAWAWTTGLMVSWEPGWKRRRSCATAGYPCPARIWPDKALP